MLNYYKDKIQDKLKSVGIKKIAIKFSGTAKNCKIIQTNSAFLEGVHPIVGWVEPDFSKILHEFCVCYINEKYSDWENGDVEKHIQIVVHPQGETEEYSQSFDVKF